MKRIFAMLLAFCVVSVIVGCAVRSPEPRGMASSNPSEPKMSETSEAQPVETEKRAETENPTPYAAKIIGKEVRDGTVVVKVEWTNNSDETIPFSAALDAQAFQNGIALNYSPLPLRESEQFTDVRPGASLTVLVAFELRDDSDVEAEISEYAGAGGDVIARD